MDKEAWITIGILIIVWIVIPLFLGTFMNKLGGPRRPNESWFYIFGLIQRGIRNLRSRLCQS